MVTGNLGITAGWPRRSLRGGGVVSPGVPLVPGHLHLLHTQAITEALDVRPKAPSTLGHEMPLPIVCTSPVSSGGHICSWLAFRPKGRAEDGGLPQGVAHLGRCPPLGRKPDFRRWERVPHCRLEPGREAWGRQRKTLNQTTLLLLPFGAHFSFVGLLSVAKFSVCGPACSPLCCRH